MNYFLIFIDISTNTFYAIFYGKTTNTYDILNESRGRNGQPSPKLEMWEMSPHLFHSKFKTSQ